jgi:hypothetical protein
LLQGFWLFGAFFLLYFMYNTYRVDWFRAHETQELMKMATVRPYALHVVGMGTQ